MGGRRPADDRLVRGEPRALDRPCRLAAGRRRPRAADEGHDDATPLRLDELVERDGIFHRAGQEESAYKRQWEAEAADDHVASAIARGAAGADDYETLTGKITPLWDRFPDDLHAETVLEIGSGYGRIPLYLGREHNLTWATYCAVDISETMLRRLLEYRARFELVPSGRLYPVCASADALPLEDDSVDLVLTSAVFLHMGKTFVARTRGGDRARSQARRRVRLRRLVSERA